MHKQERTIWGAIDAAIRRRTATPTEIQEANMTENATAHRQLRMLEEDVALLQDLKIPGLLADSAIRLRAAGFSDAHSEGPLPVDAVGGRFSPFTFSRLTWDVRPSDRNEDTLLFDQARFLVTRRIMGSTRELGDITGIAFELPDVIQRNDHLMRRPAARRILLHSQTPEEVAAALSLMIDRPMTYIMKKPNSLMESIRNLAGRQSRRDPVQIYDGENFESPVAAYHPVRRERFWLP